VRVVLTDVEFSARYGDPSNWAERLWTDRTTLVRYGADLYNLSREASLALSLNLDVMVQPVSETTPLLAEPRLRLDDLPAILSVPGLEQDESSPKGSPEVQESV